VEVVLLIWSSGLASKVQLPVASVTAVTRTCEELNDLPEPAHKYKGRKGDGYTFSCRAEYKILVVNSVSWSYLVKHPARTSVHYVTQSTAHVEYYEAIPPRTHTTSWRVT
jgi:hypothetical protein